MAELKTEDMTVAEYAAYKVEKPVTDAIGGVPIVGPGLVGMASLPCLISDAIGFRPAAVCQAVHDTLGELQAPAFPKGDAAHPFGRK